MTRAGTENMLAVDHPGVMGFQHFDTTLGDLDNALQDGGAHAGNSGGPTHAAGGLRPEATQDHAKEEEEEEEATAIARRASTRPASCS